MCGVVGSDGEEIRGLWELFVLSVLFFCTLEATLKNSLFLNSKTLKFLRLKKFLN